jgi:hypothetical protein
MNSETENDYVGKDGEGNGCGIRLERLRRTARNLCKNSLYAGQDSNRELPKYKSEVVLLDPACSLNMTS